MNDFIGIIKEMRNLTQQDITKIHHLTKKPSERYSFSTSAKPLIAPKVLLLSKNYTESIFLVI
jgi:hypothetical protein